MKAAALLVLLVSGLLLGCAAPTVQISQGQAALLYADAREFYGRMAGPLAALCQAQRVPPATCADLRALQGRMIDLDPQIRAAIAEAKSPIDYAALEKIFGVALRMGSVLGTFIGLP